ncbi:hypothetical protein BGZ76_006135, partial [Entomortierella beljakovae]
MLDMQGQALGRLIIIQNCTQAVHTQPYELHEYPTPRLFIVLPGRHKLRNLFSNLFRHYFHEIHLERHEGYYFEQPPEFFEKYGDYVGTAGEVAPALSQLKLVEGVEIIQKSIGALVSQA